MGIYRVYLDSINKTRKMTTWNRFDLETLGFSLIVSKIIYPGMLDTKIPIEAGSHGSYVSKPLEVNPCNLSR